MILLGTEWTWCFRKWWFPELLCVHWQFHTHPPFRSTDLWGAKEPWQQDLISPVGCLFIPLPSSLWREWWMTSNIGRSTYSTGQSGFQPNFPHNPSGLSSVRSMVFEVRKIAILIISRISVCDLGETFYLFSASIFTLCLT